MEHGVSHFEIPANDPEKLSGFYQQLFGWQIQKMPMGDQAYWTLGTVTSDDQGMPQQVGAINGGMYMRQSPQQQPVNYVNVESVDEYVGKAQSLGASLMMGKMAVPGMGWFAILNDPEGNSLGLWQTDPAAA